MEIRLVSSSALSGSRTTGSPSTISLSGGWGRDSRSLKNGEAMANTDLWTWKLTLSDDLIIKLASETSKDLNEDVAESIWARGAPRSCRRDRADSACKKG